MTFLKDVYTGQINFLKQEIVKLEFDLNFKITLDPEFYKKLIKNHIKSIKMLQNEIHKIRIKQEN